MFPRAIQRLLDSILGPGGESDSSLRRMVFGCAARRGSPAEIRDPALRAWIEKVASQAYRITDSDLDTLRRAGYSDGHIFELTIAAAAGAAEMRYRAGLEAVDEALR